MGYWVDEGRVCVLLRLYSNYIVGNQRVYNSCSYCSTGYIYALKLFQHLIASRGDVEDILLSLKLQLWNPRRIILIRHGESEGNVDKTCAMIVMKLKENSKYELTATLEQHVIAHGWRLEERVRSLPIHNKPPGWHAISLRYCKPPSWNGSSIYSSSL